MLQDSKPTEINYFKIRAVNFDFHMQENGAIIKFYF